MDLRLERAYVKDSELIHEMQHLGFCALLEKYHDHDISPGAATLEHVRQRLSSDSIDCYFICLRNEKIGYIRIRKIDENTCRLSQISILPLFQNKGSAQAAIAQAEALYPQTRLWVLDTIKQELKLRHLYEKMGYRLTGSEHHIKPGMDLVDYSKQIL